jgi:hypothetical protein
MLLRRITGHVKEQNWFAVAIDLAIVVFGVFIGIQVSNWNEARSLHARESELLAELKRELEAEVETTDALRTSIEEVLAAIRRSMAVIDGGGACGGTCWPVLADFFHASQWFPTAVTMSTYGEMRRQGLPRSKTVVTAVDAYLAQNATTSGVLAELPGYRHHVRSLMPIRVHDAYWSHCYVLRDGVEELLIENCPPGVPNEVAAAAVDAIVSHPETRPLLTFWYSEIRPTPAFLADQNATAARAIAAINAELEIR